MAGLREVKFRAFIYNEKPGRYIQVVIQEAGDPGKGTPKQSKLSSLSSGSFSKHSREKSREGLYTKERTMRLVTRGKRQGNHTRLKSWGFTNSTVQCSNKEWTSTAPLSSTCWRDHRQQVIDYCRCVQPEAGTCDESCPWIQIQTHKHRERRARHREKIKVRRTEGPWQQWLLSSYQHQE